MDYRHLPSYVTIPLAIALATVVNLFLSYLSRFFYIPLYLDSVATIFVAAEFGLIPAVLVAVCTNGYLIIRGISFWPFLLCHVATAVTAGLLFKKGKDISTFLWIGVISAILNTLIGSPYAIKNVKLENIDAIHKGLLLATNSVNFAFYYGGSITNFLDKILSAYIASAVYNLIAPPHTSVEQNVVQNDGQDIQASQSGRFYISIKYLILVLSLLNVVCTSVIKSFLSDEAKMQFYIESKISNGFDLLVYSSLILIFLVILILVSDRQKALKEKRILDALNAETTKLSRNLHDSTLQNLAMAQMMVESKDEEKSLYWIKEAVKNLRYLCGQLKLDYTESFSSHIKNVLEVFESSYKIQTEFFSSSEMIDNFSQTQKSELNYILNECLSNAARHSGATKITVKIVDVANHFIMKISDNGCGFELENVEPTKSAHFGLGNIQERVKGLGGTIDFVNNNGTEITVKIPI